MSSSAFVFAHNSVCLRAMGEQITNQLLLYKLCLVDSWFNAIFSPFLYRRIVLRTNHSWAGLLESRHVELIRAITITRGLSERTESLQLNELAQQLLKRTVNLEAITWRAPLTQTTIDQLHRSCRNIKCLHVVYPEHMEDRVLLMTSAADEAQGREPDADVQEARRLYLPQDFSAFTRLHELTLTNMYGDLRRWKRLIVKILRNSPGLTKLSLSLSDYAVERSYHDGRLDDYVEFFTSLCDEYAQPNTPPLKLRSLECGTAIYPDDLDALEKLTDLSYLEEVHIDNTGVYVHGDTIILYDEDGYSGLVFDAFLSPRCPKLRRFSASELRTDVFDALCGAQAAKLTRQIAVSFDRQDMGDERTSLFLRADKEHPNLPLTLRMMDLDLDETADEDQTAEELLEDLVATNADTLDGLAVHLSLSLLGSAGTAEESSTSDLDLGFLNARLRRLPHLRQLLVGIIEMDRHFSKQEAAVRCAGIAENIARSVPQLRYICVCGTYWRIWRLGGNDSERPAVELERLDEARDRQGVELFAHSIYQCNWPDNRE